MVSHKFRSQLAWLGALFFFLIDFFTKKLTVINLPGPGDYGFPSEVVLFQNFLGIDLSITHATNSGAAWGFFAHFPKTLIVLRIILITLLLVVILLGNVDKFKVALIFLFTGAFSNVIDYFVYGHVIDMIHVKIWGYDYPVFNVADSLICLSTLWMIWCMLFREEE